MLQQMHQKIKATASYGRNVSIYGKKRKMHLLSILPDQRTGNAAITTSTSSMLIFWLAFEGLLHERKLLLHPPSSFGSPSEQVLLLPTPINSVTVIHHMIPFSGDTTPSTSIFALAVCWSLNSIHFFLLAPFHNNNDKKK